MPEISSPLARLVLFMICLSIAGALVAGVFFFTAGLPQQGAVQVPENSERLFLKECLDASRQCEENCKTAAPDSYSSCRTRCDCIQKLCDSAADDPEAITHPAFYRSQLERCQNSNQGA